MPKYLVVNNTYQELHLALYTNTQHIATLTSQKHLVSKNFPQLLSQLLATENLSPSSLDFIAINQGPGPFTTLRVVIASVNGLAFATGLPLVGVDGLEAMAHEYHNQKYPVTAIILNAFNKDLYYLIDNYKSHSSGYKNYLELFESLKKDFSAQTIRFIGNGVELYHADIVEQFGSQAFIPSPLPLDPTLEAIAQLGLEQWHAKKNVQERLLPLYLKGA